MQIVIPMSGFGERFRRAGYDVPKPLIEVDGKTIIEHVIDLFPGDHRFLFICNQGHLDEASYRMREILERACPKGRIIGIPPHKLGPVSAVLQAAELAGTIDPAEPTIVNYCDFTCYWDFADFQQFVRGNGCDGAVICYTGFHPHMLRSVNFAYVKQTDGWVEDIQEKKPYTDQPQTEFASSGTYYFRSGALMLDCFARSMRPDLALNGEFYVSLAYKPLLEDKRRIAVYEIAHFMQWGTPEDLGEYRAFSQMFRHLLRPAQEPLRHAGTLMVPMAGLGSRFASEGYATPKPLIPVSGRPMVVQATADLPRADHCLFILRADLPGIEDVKARLTENFAQTRFVTLDRVTDGQARTCLLGLSEVDLSQPLTIGACDNGALYRKEGLERLMADPEIDVIVWAARGYPGAAIHPQMYGWLDVEGDRVKGVSVKKPLADPAQDPIIIGTFTFKRADDFKQAAERMIARGGAVNGEFYVDSCIEDAIALGRAVRIFEIDDYLCWGTPNDLKRFNYWQACFHKWAGHPYRLEDDADTLSSHSLL